MEKIPVNPLRTNIVEFETMNITWPDVFITGELDEDITRDMAIAYGLTGWGNCYLSESIPEKFGEGMQKLGHFLGITPLPKNFERLIEGR